MNWRKAIRRNKHCKRSFLQDEQGVSEEFTSLPALSVVMVGFTLFVLLMANTYSAYQIRVEELEKYQTASCLAAKLTNPDCCFIRSGGAVDYSLLHIEETTTFLNSMRDNYRRSHVDFIVRISWGNNSEFIPGPVPRDIGDRVAVSTYLDIYLNDAEMVPGMLTVILWRTS